MKSIFKLCASITVLITGVSLFGQKPEVKFNVIPGYEFQATSVGFVNVEPDSQQTSQADGNGRVELGVFANVSQSDLRGMQLAGFSNVSACSVNGLQLTSVSNYNRHDVKGSQMAGISNVNLGELNGLQMAGYSNVSGGKLSGVQLSGLSNVALDEVEGTQIAGMLNFAAEEVSMAQVGGFANYSGKARGAQAAGFANCAMTGTHFFQGAGFANYAGYNRGIQLAGFGNVTTGTNSGFQLSGFFNFARNNEGVQLSFINISDSSSGTPFGFFSFVRQGYHVLEASYNEVFPANVAFKTGVSRFYNIFEAGLSEDDLHLAYGLGTMKRLGKKFYVNFDLTAGQLFETDQTDWEEFRVLVRFTPSINWQILPKVGLAVGPSLNLYMEELSGEGLSTPLSRYSFAESTSDDIYSQAWIGARVALRFF